MASSAGFATSQLARQIPFVWIRSAAARPVVIASANGNEFRNGGTETCVQRAFRKIAEGSDVLDALIAGVNLNELDPLDASVGFGGLPNADGVVQLDSCCMHGPKRWAGGVAALEGVRTPSLVAKAVAELTDHHLIVGAGAQQFARNAGFPIEPDLNTEHSRRAWMDWKRRTDSEHYLDPARRHASNDQILFEMIREGRIDRNHAYGTINCDGINSSGDLCGVTTTSGLAFKIPGRVGDSPILGAGLYVDNQVGAAGSTGRGEANLYNLCSFLIIEEMRRGAHPIDAGMAALRRVASNTEPRLMSPAHDPTFGLNFYMLDKEGRHGAVAFTKGARYAVCDENGARFEDCRSVHD